MRPIISNTKSGEGGQLKSKAVAKTESTLAGSWQPRIQDARVAGAKAQPQQANHSLTPRWGLVRGAGD